MKKLKQGLLLVITSLLILTGIAPVAKASSSITVGSKNFTESKVVSEIYALALEQAGYKVTRKPNISNSVVFRAVQAGQIDVYPEYTGTIVQAYLKKNSTTKSAATMAKLAKQGVANKGLVTFKYAPADDRQGIAVTKRVADKYGIKTLSDLQQHANQIRFASQGEFDQRADALPGMNKTYGEFKFKSKKDYDDSLKYKLMSTNKADAAPVSTTDGQLATGKYVLLEDDKHLWPPYNLVPLVNQKAAKNHPKMESTLNKVNAKLTSKTLMQLNKQVDVDGQNYKTVAKNWYSQNMK